MAKANDETAVLLHVRHGKMRLGEWLVRRQLIRRGDLFRALDIAFRHGCRVGDACIWLGLLDRETVEQEVSAMKLRRSCILSA